MGTDLGNIWELFGNYLGTMSYPRSVSRPGWLGRWLVDWVAGWLLGWLAGWLAGWPDGLLVVLKSLKEMVSVCRGRQ